MYRFTCQVNTYIGQKYRLFINNWYVNRGFNIDFTESTCQFTSCGNALSVYITGASAQSICNGSNTTLNAVASGGASKSYTYVWSPITGLNNSNTASVIASPTINTTYTVTVTDALGAKAINSVVINVGNLSLSTSKIPNIAQVCPGTNSAITANPTGGNGTYSYLWSSGQTTKSINVAPQTTTTYTVTVTAGGCTKTASTNVIVVDTPGCSFSGKAANNTNNGNFATDNIDLRLSPNPTSAVFTATLNQLQREAAQFLLYDYSGRLLQKQVSDQSLLQHQVSFDLSNLPSGIYYVKARNNGKEITKSIVKQ